MPGVGRGPPGGRGVKKIHATGLEHVEEILHPVGHHSRSHVDRPVGQHLIVAGHPFQQEPRIILSPHIGGVTSAAYVNMGVAAARNVLDALARAGSPA